MEKLSSTKIAQVLHDAGLAIRHVTAERDAALAKCASYERRAQAQKVAAEMHSKGINLDKTAEELTNELEKAAEQGDLPIIHRAVDMIGPNMGLGSLNNDEKTASAGGSDFERFIFGGIG
jgi:TPR repeat protein